MEVKAMTGIRAQGAGPRMTWFVARGSWLEEGRASAKGVQSRRRRWAYRKAREPVAPEAYPEAM